jgi:cytochrome oxidase Cu insertion factor (SCO1/SenC/PrrC family)
MNMFKISEALKIKMISELHLITIDPDNDQPEVLKVWRTEV